MDKCNKVECFWFKVNDYENCSNDHIHAELPRQCIKNNFNHFLDIDEKLEEWHTSDSKLEFCEYADIPYGRYASYVVNNISAGKDKLQFAFTLKNGCNIYYKNNEAGGRTYYSDEVGGGVVVWDTCLVNADTFLEVITFENNLYRRDRDDKNRNI